MSANYIPTGRAGTGTKKFTGLEVLEGTADTNENDAKNIKNGIYGKAEMSELVKSNEYAKEQWERLAPQLERLGLLDGNNAEQFAMYCIAYSHWREAEEFIMEHGSIVKTPSGYWQQVPHVAISMQNQKIMLNLAARFGLTPSDRARLDLEAVPVQSDPLDMLLSE